MKFVIEGRLDGLNDYIRACRTNFYVGNDMKKKNQKTVKKAIKRAKLHNVTKYPIKLKITWYEPNSKRDIDNITFASKFILDELVKSEIICDDSQKYVSEIQHSVQVDKDKPRIEVEITEKEE